MHAACLLLIGCLLQSEDSTALPPAKPPATSLPSSSPANSPTLPSSSGNTILPTERPSSLPESRSSSGLSIPVRSISDVPSRISQPSSSMPSAGAPTSNTLPGRSLSDTNSLQMSNGAPAGSNPANLSLPSSRAPSINSYNTNNAGSSSSNAATTRPSYNLDNELRSTTNGSPTTAPSGQPTNSLGQPSYRVGNGVDVTNNSGSGASASRSNSEVANPYSANPSATRPSIQNGSSYNYGEASHNSSGGSLSAPSRSMTAPGSSPSNATMPSSSTPSSYNSSNRLPQSNAGSNSYSLGSANQDDTESRFTRPSTAGSMGSGTRSQYDGSTTPTINRPGQLSTNNHPYDRAAPPADYSNQNGTIRPAGGSSSSDGRSPRLAANTNANANAASDIGRLMPRLSEDQPPEDPTATELLNSALFAWPYGEDGLSGTAVRLADVLTPSANAEERHQTVKAYWQLAVAVADYHFATDELQWLRALSPAEADLDETERMAAIEAAGARFREARLAVFNAQNELTQVSSTLSENDKPLPLDAPFIGRYLTHFDTYAQVRRMPTSLAKIDQALPLTLDLILSRTDAVRANQRYMLKTRDAYNQGRASISSVLDGFTRTRDQRLAMLGVVRDYNFLIADYAFAVGPGNADRNHVIAMLIDTKKGPQQIADQRGSSRTTDPAVQPAAALQRTSNQGWATGQPGRFNR